ncbi:hypothetical protein DPMN_005271 [Dreissena polymorpha]|uniref:Uncharacterized protein n=1 Tax=Dreissena polymorpha TaxID=45954 RepID=A0A9D4MQ14_DREPO|nr:hypothetical protein DPMN_005270 [Dreissena polymorpha]KAH3881346.1 hypothetical protein DPMN_005271 [Dreissena polymorpha]
MKATVLNNFFTEQTLLDDSEAPNLSHFIYYNNETLTSLVVTPTEVESVLRGLPLNKASGPNSVNNRIPSIRKVLRLRLKTTDRFRS